MRQYSQVGLDELPVVLILLCFVLLFYITFVKQSQFHQLDLSEVGEDAVEILILLFITHLILFVLLYHDIDNKSLLARSLLYYSAVEVYSVLIIRVNKT